MGAHGAGCGDESSHALPRLSENPADPVESRPLPQALPAPAPVDLATMMYQQNRLLEALVTTITAQAQGNQGNPRPVVHHNGNDNIIADFHRLQPLKFGGSDNPIEADDWLREIEMKLEVVHADDMDKVLLAVQQLMGHALAWWQSYREVNEDAIVMGWADFVKIF
jgi:hypothetical protein